GFYMGEVAYADSVRQYDWLAPVQPLAPQALAVAELPVEVWTRARFNRQFLGAIGVQETVEVAKVEDSDHTLAKSISLAAEGNTEAEALVDLNVATATAEGCLKDGYYRKVTKD